MTAKKTIVAGYICLDIHPDSPSSQQAFDESGSLRWDPIQIGPASFAAGGLVPGVGMALHYLGLPISLIGKIGDDPFGDRVKVIIDKNAPQLFEGLIIDPATPTGYRLFLDDVYYFPGANNTFYASDIPRDVLRQGDLFHFGYPALMRSIFRSEGGELVSILQRVRREGLSTSLDFGLPDPGSKAGEVDWQNVLANTLPLVDVYKPGIEQLFYFLKTDNYKQIIAKDSGDFSESVSYDLLGEIGDWVMNCGVKILLVDLGSRGLYLRTNRSEAWVKKGRGMSGLGEDWIGHELWLPALKIKNEGYCNPHEILVAGFLAGILTESNPEMSLLLSAAARAAALENAGDPRKLLPRADLLARIDREWDFLPLALEKYGFRKGQNGIWKK